MVEITGFVSAWRSKRKRSGALRYFVFTLAEHKGDARKRSNKKGVRLCTSFGCDLNEVAAYGGLNETPTEHALISYENISYKIISYKIIMKAVRNKISRLYILVFTFLPFWTSGVHCRLSAISTSANFTNMCTVFVFNDTAFKSGFAAEMLACATIFACLGNCTHTFPPINYFSTKS